jgi:hypothetical protein
MYFPVYSDESGWLRRHEASEKHMKFFCLHEGYYESVPERIEYLQRASQLAGVEFCSLDSLKVDYSRLPVPKSGDLLYNCSLGSETLESLLLSPQVTTFYLRQPSLISRPVDTSDLAIVHHKASLPAPRTVFQMSRDRKLLRQYVDYLGGFPLVIKAKATTRGQGTIKVESWPGLLSTVDFLMSTQSRFIMREFIPNTGTARIVVLGESVIASEFRENLENDFRVSGGDGEINYYAKEFGEDCCELAIKAVKLANLATAGVDIIFDRDNQPRLLEVNFPHNFIPPQVVTGVDIASLMVRWLRDKTNATYSL